MSNVGFYNWTKDFKSLLKQKFLSSNELIDLIRQYQSSKNKNKQDSLREVIILNNVRLVAHIASRFSKKYNNNIEDLFQDGIFGLMKSIDRFDPDKGYKFSTYATYWIERSIQDSLDFNHPISISNSYRYIISRFMKLSKSCKNKSELTRKLRENNIRHSIGALENMTAIIFNDNFFVDIDGNVGEEGHQTMSDFIPSKNKTPEEEFFEAWERKHLLDVIHNRLKEREQQVILERYLSGRFRSLDSVAKMLNIGVREARFAERKGIEKIKLFIENPYIFDEIKKHVSERKKKLTKTENVRYNVPVSEMPLRLFEVGVGSKKEKLKKILATSPRAAVIFYRIQVPPKDPLSVRIYTVDNKKFKRSKTDWNQWDFKTDSETRERFTQELGRCQIV